MTLFFNEMVTAPAAGREAARLAGGEEGSETGAPAGLAGALSTATGSGFLTGDSLGGEEQAKAVEKSAAISPRETQRGDGALEGKIESWERIGKPPGVPGAALRRAVVVPPLRGSLSALLIRQRGPLETTLCQ